MNNKISILITIVVLIHTSIFSQSKLSVTDTKFKEHKEAGDKYYGDDEFYLAALEYHKAEKLKPTDHYVLWRLAESYRNYQDYDDAEGWYAKLCATPDNTYPLAPLQLGLMQKTNGKYLEAESTLSNFIKNFKPKTEEDKLELKEAEFEYKGCVYALELMRKPVKQNNFKLLPAPVNSKSVDYAPMIFFHDSSIVITSQRSDAKGTELNLATGEARSDNFRFEKVGNKWLRHHNDDNFDIVNTPKDDGAGELTHDQSKYYYTICDPECDIYVSKKVAGKFTKPLKLNKNINIPNYWNAQPTVSPTADTMFFVSKRPNGKAMQPNKQYDHDIWMSINKDRTGATEDWGPAVNLTSVNTPYIEIAPFWDDHTNTIYFASNGHVGFGGWDVYQAKGKNRDSIVNLGMPFNSSRDDFYFTLGKNKGYLVSNRMGGIGKDDIYTFDINVKESTIGDVPKDSFANAESIASVGRIILNDTQQPVADLPVFLKDENGNVVREGRTNANGEFRFENLPPDKNYKITMNENDPRLKTNLNYEVNKKAPLVPNVDASGIVTDKITKKPLANVPIEIKDATGKVVSTTKTDATGKYVAKDLPGGAVYKTVVSNTSPLATKASVSSKLTPQLALAKPASAQTNLSNSGQTASNSIAETSTSTAQKSGTEMAKSGAATSNNIAETGTNTAQKSGTEIAKSGAATSNNIVETGTSPSQKSGTEMAKSGAATSNNIAETGTSTAQKSGTEIAKSGAATSNNIAETGTNTAQKSGTEIAKSGAATSNNIAETGTNTAQKSGTEMAKSGAATSNNIVETGTSTAQKSGTEIAKSGAATSNNIVETGTSAAQKSGTEIAKSGAATSNNIVETGTSTAQKSGTEMAKTGATTSNNLLETGTSSAQKSGTEMAKTGATTNNIVETGTSTAQKSGTEIAKSGAATSNSIVETGTSTAQKSGTEMAKSGAATSNNIVETGTSTAQKSGTEMAKSGAITNNIVETGTSSAQKSGTEMAKTGAAINNIVESNTNNNNSNNEISKSSNINTTESAMTSIEKPKSSPKKSVSFSELPSENSESQNSVENGTKSRFAIDNFKISSSAIKPSRTFFENVYFDFNSAELSNISKKAMDQLVEFYGAHKEIQIEIKSYSDGFGDPVYNKNLAEQRGKACYDYFEARGVDQTSLVITPSGEDNPVASNGSFAGRQLNRRVEFAIIGSKAPFQPEAMAHVLEPRMTLFSVAKKYGMTMAELREWNGGINPEDIKAYSILRVKRPTNASKISPASIQYINSGTEEMRFENGQFVPAK